ncbi:NAD(P)-binding protein [Microthyrium microscopicum]|uniref:NAD(P)-binding protein n=1 Tax=Microthyrium microscopicum TaxID=703497 RepID=A0A6A6UB56_9PEZI|nr:NAD(P)-binding protein [Microthyrium microscopicum]
MPSAIIVKKTDGKPGKVYYPLHKVSLPPQTPTADQVVIRMSAAALNHRDLFIRQHLYPGISFSTPMLADGCGVVSAAGANAKQWIGKRVVLNPGTGWKDSPEGPEEGQYAIVGGTKFNPAGTLAESMLFDAGECEEAPEHLSDVEAAALPLAGLTGWRALMTKSGNAKPGHNVLVTGIGGGVAIMVLLFGAAAGCNVYVTSSSPEKLKKAQELGAKGGVNYREKDWASKLESLLPEKRPFLDTIIDGAGGDIIKVGNGLLKQGGVIVSYGMTLGPKADFLMQAVLKNVEVRGSTMGSRKEFGDMVQFVREKKLKPIVSRAVKGLDLHGIDGLFEDMKKGSQFGKLVVQINENSSKL